MKKLILKSILLGLFLFLTLQIFAQELVPKKLENVKWHYIVSIDFKTGQEDRAKQIIYDHFKPASEKAGTKLPVIFFETMTGSYDMIIAWEMEKGVESLNWEISPENVKWMKALAEQEGSKEEAMALTKEYTSLIRTTQRDLVYQKQF